MTPRIAGFAYVMLGEVALVLWWPHWSPLRSVAVFLCFLAIAVLMVRTRA